MVRHLAYRTFSRACRALGAPSMPRTGLRVLLYHSVGAPMPGRPRVPSMEPRMFEEQMDRLVLLREWLPVPFGPPRADRLEVAVVFDDGYKDTLVTAAPILARRAIPFTVFVTAGFVKRGAAEHLAPAELRQLAAMPGAAIGAHGFSHCRLDRADDAALARELVDSRKFLEGQIGRPVTSMSYPHGAADLRVAQAARAAGYALGGTSRYGLNGPDRHPLLLCRTEITPFDTAADFELKLRGHWDWFRFRHPDPALVTGPGP